MASLIYGCVLFNYIIWFAGKSNPIIEMDLYQIDSVKFINKAFLVNNGGKSSDRHYAFDDENGFNYFIKGAPFRSIKERPYIDERFQYSSTVLTVYTDENGYQNHLRGRKSESIEVLQFKMEGIKYIDLEKVNADNLKNAILRVIIFTLLFVFFVVGTMRQK